jgi:hypothetical protein
MGLGSLGQTKELDLRREYSARLIQFDNAFKMCTSAPNGRSQRRHIGTLWLWRLSTRGDEGSAAARFKHRERPLRHVAPNRVENGVAIGDSLREISGVVVDDFIGSEASHICVVRRTRGRNHTGTDMLGELDGKSSHSPCSALY